MFEALSVGNLLLIVAGVATAVFTGVQMWTSLLARADQIAVDFDFQQASLPPDPIEGGDPIIMPQRLVVTAVVRNRTSRTIAIRGMEISGAPLRLQSAESYEIKRTHGGIRMSCDVPVFTDKSEKIDLIIEIDLPKLASGYSSGTRSPRLRASVIIDCNSFPKRTISRSQSKLIAEEIMMQTTATIKTIS